MVIIIFRGEGGCLKHLGIQVLMERDAGLLSFCPGSSWPVSEREMLEYWLANSSSLSAGLKGVYHHSLQFSFKKIHQLTH